MISDTLLQRAKTLKLNGLVNHWDEVKDTTWIESLIGWEEVYRSQRSLDSRFRNARIGRFKLLADFDWSWPKRCDRDVVEEWMQLGFMEQANNLILSGPNAVGKTTIAQNIAYQAVLKGHTALFTTAASMLNELAALDSDSALRRRIKHYVQPALLVIDEVGYLSYSNRHADLLFEIVSHRYEEKSTLITTNKPFTEWRDIFPNAACVVSIIDRLVHHSEILNIEAESYRLKEWKDESAKKSTERAKRRKSTKTSGK
jgi:DNA replication protein DnaC